MISRVFSLACSLTVFTESRQIRRANGKGEECEGGTADERQPVAVIPEKALRQAEKDAK